MSHGSDYVRAIATDDCPWDCVGNDGKVGIVEFLAMGFWGPSPDRGYTPTGPLENSREALITRMILKKCDPGCDQKRTICTLCTPQPRFGPMDRMAPEEH